MTIILFNFRSVIKCLLKGFGPTSKIVDHIIQQKKQAILALESVAENQQKVPDIDFGLSSGETVKLVRDQQSILSYFKLLETTLSAKKWLFPVFNTYKENSGNFLDYLCRLLCPPDENVKYSQ